MPFLGMDTGADRSGGGSSGGGSSPAPFPPTITPPSGPDPWQTLADIAIGLGDTAASNAAGSTYLQELSMQLAQDQFAFSKTQWADQLKQWESSFGFSKEQFDTSTKLQREQMAQNAQQFQAQLGFNQKGQDQAWQQYIEGFAFQQDQFDFQKESFSDQLDFSKLQFEEQMGFSYDQLEQQWDVEANRLGFQREQLAQSANQFAAELGLRTSELALTREVETGKLKLGQERLSLDTELGRGGLALSKLAEKHDFEIAKGSLALNRQAQAFQEKTVNTQMLMQAAGLASSPTGAIQLAYMARNSGAPAGAIADIFSNLPFVQAALAGKTLPGFGVPEQLGGSGGSSQQSSASNDELVNAALGTEGQGEDAPVSAGESTVSATSNTGDSDPDGGIFTRGLGVTLPGLNEISEEQFGGMKSSEKLFLGALYQSETGIPIEQALGDIQKSFIPTAQTQRLSF